MAKPRSKRQLKLTQTPTGDLDVLTKHVQDLTDDLHLIFDRKLTIADNLPFDIKDYTVTNDREFQVGSPNLSKLMGCVIIKSPALLSFSSAPKDAKTLKIHAKFDTTSTQVKITVLLIGDN